MRRKKRRLIFAAAFAALSAGTGYSYYSYTHADDVHLIPWVIYNDQSPLSREMRPVACTPNDPIIGRSAKMAFCPANYAVFGTDDGHGAQEPAAVEVHARCCKLPADDILTGEHLYDLTDSCPEHYVLTGGSIPHCGRNCTIRCTRINTAKYMLGPKAQAFYWKIESRNPSSGRGGAKQIRLHNLPAAIRDALSFNYPNSTEPDDDGCVGIPFGSLLVEKIDSKCAGHFYRQLLFRETGEPVRMFPE